MVTVIVGTQWGDEGKGRVSNFETPGAAMVVRCTGGDNAGHTVVRDGEKYALHLLPSSIIEPDKMSVIATGVVINPKTLIEEIEALKKRGIEISPKNLAISDRANVITPIHILRDEADESMRGDSKIGTTKRGIGPTYEEEARRSGIIMWDLIVGGKNLLKKMYDIMRFNNPIISAAGYDTYESNDLLTMCKEYEEAGEYLRPYITDTERMINDAIDDGKKVVLEGAQSYFLDVNRGNRPYVTSSHPTASGTCDGAGIGPICTEEVIGVMKAYCSRVGEGAFPTEQKSKKVGDRIRRLGHEYGTTTGRPRRCGWLDLVMVKRAAKGNRLTTLAVNHMDTIGRFKEFKVCVAYKYHGKVIDNVPVDHENCKPIYVTFKGGWKTKGATTLEELGPDAEKFINFIEEYTGVPVAYIGIGPDAKQTIVR